MSARYAMDLTSYKGSMRTALAVLSTLAIVNSLLQTWSWNKKASKVVAGVMVGCMAGLISGGKT